MLTNNVLNLQCLEMLFPVISIHKILEATVIKLMCTKIEVA